MQNWGSYWKDMYKTEKLFLIAVQFKKGIIQKPSASSKKYIK